MLLKYLKINDVFHFKNDNEETEFIVVFESKTIIQFDSLSELNATSLCLNKEFDFLTTKKVTKLYTKIQ